MQVVGGGVQTLYNAWKKKNELVAKKAELQVGEDPPPVFQVGVSPEGRARSKFQSLKNPDQKTATIMDDLPYDGPLGAAGEFIFDLFSLHFPSLFSVGN